MIACVLRIYEHENLCLGCKIVDDYDFHINQYAARTINHTMYQNNVFPLIWNLFDECRILRWIFIFVSFGPIHDWHIENGPVSKRYQLDPILSKISGYLIHFS